MLRFTKNKDEALDAGLRRGPNNLADWGAKEGSCLCLFAMASLAPVAYFGKIGSCFCVLILIPCSFLTVVAEVCSIQ